MKRFIKKIFNLFGFDIVRTSASLKKSKSNYISCEEIVNSANLAGLSICDYVEKIWNQQGSTQAVVDEMTRSGCFENLDIICEIGPGTGRYIEKIKQLDQEQKKLEKYIIYETAEDWAEWLEDNYGLVRRDADGKSLKYELKNSCNLVHAHGVFVYLPFLQAFEYFLEMMRICTINGYIVFDFYTDEHFSTDIINTWLTSPERYPVILPRNTVIQYFNQFGFRLIHEFDNKHGHSYSHYVIFKKET
jgi:hypothetical protein